MALFLCNSLHCCGINCFWCQWNIFQNLRTCNKPWACQPLHRQSVWMWLIHITKFTVPPGKSLETLIQLNLKSIKQRCASNTAFENDGSQLRTMLRCVTWTPIENRTCYMWTLMIQVSIKYSTCSIILCKVLWLKLQLVQFQFISVYPFTFLTYLYF